MKLVRSWTRASDAPSQSCTAPKPTCQLGNRETSGDPRWSRTSRRTARLGRTRRSLGSDAPSVPSGRRPLVSRRAAAGRQKETLWLRCKKPGGQHATSQTRPCRQLRSLLQPKWTCGGDTKIVSDRLSNRGRAIAAATLMGGSPGLDDGGSGRQLARYGVRDRRALPAIHCRTCSPPSSKRSRAAETATSSPAATSR